MTPEATGIRVGFIGLGSMGGRIAALLAPAFDLSVYDAAEAAMAPFEGRANLVTSAVAVARDADVVGICVRTDAQVRACVDAVLGTLRPGAVVMIHSTVAPETVRVAADRAAQAGVVVIDSPVTTTLQGVTGRPFVFTMTGGDAQAAQRCRPLIDAYSTDTVHVGPLGSAMALKIVNNLVSLVQIVVTEEAFRIAELHSVPLEHIRAVMTGNGALTPTMWSSVQLRTHAIAHPEAREGRVVQASNGEKDLALAEALAQSVHTSSAVATFAKEQIRFAVTNGFTEGG